MKANELRIGNFIYYNWPENILKVVGLDGYDNIVFTDDDVEIKTDNPYLNPIEITEDWLENLGFKKTIINKNVPAHKIKISTLQYMVVSRWNESDFQIWIEYYPLNKVKYVHQLQNLYFALTGEELKKGKKMKLGIELKIDVTKIDKSKIFEGKKGKYLTMTTFVDVENQDQYGNNGMITHKKEADEKPAILGNCKVFWNDSKTVQSNNQEKEDIPF